MYTDEDRQSALTRALIMAGAAMTQPGPGGTLAALGRGGMMGMKAYDNTYDDIARRRIQEEALRRSALEDKLKEIALKRQEAVAQIMGGDFAPQRPAGMAGPSMADAPGWSASPMNAGGANAAPSVRAQASEAMDPMAEIRAKAAALARRGMIPEAKTLQEYLKASEEEFSPDVKYGQDGVAYIVGKRGNVKKLPADYKARDKLVETDLGDRKVFRTEYDFTPRGEMGKSMTPDARASNAVAWANYYKPELRESGTGVVATSPDGKGGLRVTQTDIPRKAERLPSGDAEKLLTLDEMVARGKMALEGVRKNPDAVGPSNAIKPSWYLNMDNAANVDTRAKISELSTFILNARSGAAVTEPEYKRLEPFLATANDNAGSAKTKLSNLIKTMDALQKERRMFYSSQGYNVPAPQFGQGGITAAAGGGGGDMPTLDAIRAELERRKKAGQ